LNFKRKFVTGTSLIGCLCVLSLPAFSAENEHTVILRWGTLKNALQYEIQISKESAVINKLTLSKDIRKWEGKFSAGVYLFEVRAIDRFERPGEWTESQLFFVPPEAPKIREPEPRHEFSFLTQTTDQTIRWDPVDHISAYHVEVTFNSRALSDFTVSEPRITLKNLRAGEYAVSVKSILDIGANAKLTRGKRWESLRVEPRNFSLKQSKVRTPKIEMPRGLIPPQIPEKMTFTWKPAENATSYLVKVTRIDRDRKKNREIAGESPAPSPTWKKNTRATSAEFEIPQEGEYRWEVQPVAETKNPLEPQVVGEAADAEFKIQTLRETFGPSEKISLEVGHFPYGYTVNSQSTSFSEMVNASAIELNAAGSFWWSRHWGILFGLGNTFMELSSVNISVEQASAFFSYRAVLLGTVRPLSFFAGVGARAQQNVEVLPPPNSATAPSVVNEFTLGPAIVFGLRKEILSNLELELKFDIFLQKLILGGATYSSFASGGNIGDALDLRVAYWFNSRWSVTLGGCLQSVHANFQGGAGSESANIDGLSARLGIQLAF
jgi:hypothetical protein